MDDDGESVINHLQLKSWVANHINLVWELDSAGKPAHNFVEILHWARIHNSTDPHDRIYALLSQPSATIDGALIIQPNYTMTTAQAYTQLALNAIEETKSVQILAFVDHYEEPDSLTTWVPNLCALNLVAPLRCIIQAVIETYSSISFSKSDRGMVLTCRGLILDTFCTMSDVIQANELTVTTLEKETQKRLPFLIDHIWTKVSMKLKINHASIDFFFSSLNLVMTGGFLEFSNSTSGKEQEQQKCDLAALILTYNDIRKEGDMDGIFASLSRVDKAFLRTLAAKGETHRFVKDITWTSMCRRVFRTSKGHIGSGPRIMREGDIYIIAPGAAYPMILRSCDGHFQLVGPALVYGFMNCEAEKLC